MAFQFALSYTKDRIPLALAHSCFTRSLIPYPEDKTYMIANMLSAPLLMLIPYNWINMTTVVMFVWGFLTMEGRYVRLYKAIGAAAANATNADEL